LRQHRREELGRDVAFQQPVAVPLGLTHKEARIIRDAERADPGITRRMLDAQLAAGEEPTKAAQRALDAS
jgi:hypothetical protein